MARLGRRHPFRPKLAAPIVVDDVGSRTAPAGPNSPASSVSDSSNGGTVAWQTPLNARASSNRYASAVLGADGLSEYLLITDFGLAVPDGATIDGITVSVEARESVGGGVWVAYLVKGGVVQDAADDKGAQLSPTTTDHTDDLGGAADLWGNTWTAAQVNASDFGVALSVYSAGGETAYIDHVLITVAYTAGGTGYTKSLTGTLTLSATITKAAAKGLTGTLTHSGALAKQPGKSLSGSATPSGSLAKAAAKSLSGSASLSGAVARAVAKALSATLTMSAALANSAAKGLSGTLTLSAALSRSAAKALSATLSLSGAIARSAGQALAGALSASGALAKSAAKSVSGAMSPSGTLVNSAGKVLSAALTLSGAVANSAGKALSGTLSASAALAKSAAKGLSGAMTLAGSLTNVLSATAGYYFRKYVLSRRG